MKKNISTLIFIMVIPMLLSFCSGSKNELEKSDKVPRDLQFSVLTEVQVLPVINQNTSGTCWSFATSSFLESEIMRIKGEQIDLSEMYFVRGAYILKTRNYVLRQGTARFTEGGLNHDPIISAMEFGIVPHEVYTGLINKDTIHDHREMFEVLATRVKEYASPANKLGTGWKVEVPAILDKYMGKEPTQFEFEGEKYTPLSFIDYVKINPEDYLTITSFTHAPFYIPFILNIPANWANERFYNLPLDEFMQNIDHAIENGFSLAVDLDASEPTFTCEEGIATLPEKQINPQMTLAGIRPEKEVDQQARQAEFENFSTTDDHLMHIVGKVKDQYGIVYYKTKNSWGPNACKQGYMYLSIPYLRMKGISVLLHKEGLTESTKKKLLLE